MKLCEMTKTPENLWPYRKQSIYNPSQEPQLHFTIAYHCNPTTNHGYLIH